GTQETSVLARRHSRADARVPGVEERTADGERLVHREGGRAADARARRAIRAPVNRHLLELADIRVKDRPPRGRFWLRRLLPPRCGEVAFRWGPHRDHPA